MQGIFISGRRSPTKKALKEAVAAHPEKVFLEATSFFGNEYEGPLDTAPDGRYDVVGPDPHTSRKWYANIDKKADAISVR